MQIINLTTTVRAILLGTRDLVLKPKSKSSEFFLTEKIFLQLIQSPDYQNRYRFIMDASERSMMANYKVIPGVVINSDEASNILKNMEVNIFPPRIDIFGNLENPPVEESPILDSKESKDLEDSDSDRIDPTLEWDKPTKGVQLDKVTSDTTYRTLNNPNNLPIKYSSSNEEVATIDEEGDIEVIGKGNTIISAKFEGDEDYYPIEATFELIVK